MLGVTLTAADECPRCHDPLVTERDALPWCSSCEWNLERYEPERRRPELGWPLVDRTTHRLAYRLAQRQFTALAGRPVGRPGWSAARIVLLFAAVVLLAGTLACLAFGIYLIAYHFPTFLIIPGTVLVLIAFALRPRFPRLDPYAEPLTRDQAPTLFGVVDRVAAAVGAPPPQVIAIDDGFNAWATACGIRRRRVLCLGLPLLGVLRPQERVALLGHELGHFVNGDIRRGPLTRVALSTLGELAELLRPTRRQPFSGGGLVNAVSELLARIVLSVLRFLAWTGHVLLLLVGQRDAQRAEYLADELGARAGGSTACTTLTDILVAEDVVTMMIMREARLGRGPDGWRAAVDQAREALLPRLRGLRQLSVRDRVSLFASHPPAGLRSRMVVSRISQAPTVWLSEAESARLDDELADRYERVRRSLAAG